MVRIITKRWSIIEYQGNKDGQAVETRESITNNAPKKGQSDQLIINQWNIHDSIFKNTADTYVTIAGQRERIRLV